MPRFISASWCAHDLGMAASGAARQRVERGCVVDTRLGGTRGGSQVALRHELRERRSGEREAAARGRAHVLEWRGDRGAASHPQPARNGASFMTSRMRLKA